MRNPFKDLKDKSPDNLFKVYIRKKEQFMRCQNWWHAQKQLGILYKMYQSEVMK